MSKFIAVYVRVSTRKQNMRSQEPDLQRWADSQDEPVRWYRDTFTGKSMDRPEWQKLESAMQENRLSAIVCWRLDRLARSAKQLTALFEEIRTRKMNLISLKENIDLNTAAGRMMAQVIAAMAEYETELRSERIVAGVAAARAAGKTWGGGPTGPRKLKPAMVKTVLSLHKHGERVVNIARSVGLSRMSVYKVLRDNGITP